MDLNFGLNLTQEQKLIMTQEMQLSVKLLQMSSMELSDYVENQVSENPILDFEEGDKSLKNEKEASDISDLMKYFEASDYKKSSYTKDDETSPFAYIACESSLTDYLLEQIGFMELRKSVKTVCKYIIESLDSRGYLSFPTEEIAKELNIDNNAIAKALEIVQSLEPSGIAARDLKECLIIQLQRKGLKDTNLYKIVNDYLEYVADNKYGFISENLNISKVKAQEYGDIIKKLEPKPSRGFYTGESTTYITPDAYIRRIGQELHVIINDSLMPKLTINNFYKEILNDNKNKEAEDYIKDKFNSALFLVKSIEHRKSTIYNVLCEIVKIQQEYFLKGKEYLKPMTLKDISEALDMHESTVSRAIREKYVDTEQGVVKIKDLFKSGVTQGVDEAISSNSVKFQIKKLIEEENKEKPLSDQELCDILVAKGMNIKRRTVAKYREELGFKSSSKRKRF